MNEWRGRGRGLKLFAFSICKSQIFATLVKTHGSEIYKKADAFIRDLFQMIKKFAALLLIGMASPYQMLDWYGGRHTCHTASGAPGHSEGAS